MGAVEIVSEVLITGEASLTEFVEVRGVRKERRGIYVEGGMSVTAKVQNMARLSYELRLDEMEERSTSAAVGFFFASRCFSSKAHVPGFQIANALGRSG
jgi:hypothetical protein